MGAAEELAPIAIVEQLTPGEPGMRHRWTYAVCILARRSPRVLHEEHGDGPLGRLRALQRARDYCASQGLAATEIPHEAERKGPVARSMYWARLLKRLREQGVL
jgi:hypothetical protein